MESALPTEQDLDQNSVSSAELGNTQPNDLFMDAGRYENPRKKKLELKDKRLSQDQSRAFGDVLKPSFKKQPMQQRKHSIPVSI